MTKTKPYPAIPWTSKFPPVHCTSHICDHFGRPTFDTFDTRPCHAFVFRIALTPRKIERNPCSKPPQDRFATLAGAVQRFWYVNYCEHSRSLLAFLHSSLVLVCFPLAKPAFALARVPFRTFASGERSETINQQSWPGRQDLLGACRTVRTARMLPLQTVRVVKGLSQEYR